MCLCCNIGDFSFHDIIKNDIKILSELKKNKTLFITRVDKGNTIVIMVTDDYDQ